MIEILHPTPSMGTIPIANVIEGVDMIVHEIGANNAHSASALIYAQIRELSWTMESIKGETSLTITTAKDGSITFNEVGHTGGMNEEMSVSIGFGFATANATAFSSGVHTALAIAETAAAAVGHLADAVAVAWGDQATANTAVG